MSFDPAYDEDYWDFLCCLRAVLGKKPLKHESLTPELFTLDGVRFKSQREWSVELGVSLQAVSQRRKRIRARLLAGDRHPYRVQVQGRNFANA